MTRGWAWSGVVFAGLTAFLLVSCRPSGPSLTPVASSTQVARPTALVVIGTPTVTRTEVPPSDTPEPSATVTVAPATPTSTAPARAIPTAAAAEPVIPTPPPRDLVDLQKRLRASSPAVAQPTKGPPPDYSVGLDQTFWVANQITSRYFKMRARIVAKTPHAYWYVQDGSDLPSADVKSAADYFETHTYAVEHQLFGSEWSPGIDDDVHITILAGDIPGVGGYYSTADEYSTAVNPYSNQREMIYINLGSVRPGAPDFNATVAHEFMHMIQFNVHRWQNSWVDEGSAELAAQAVTGSASSAIGAFERQPQTQLNAWASEPDAAIPHYGAAYLFMRYVAEQFGGFAAIGKVVAEPSRGMASFQRFFDGLSPPRRFDDVFADWVAANALDDPSIDGARFGYHSLALSMQIQPGPSVGATLNGEAQQFGTDYYRIQPTGPTTLGFDGAPRTQLIGAVPPRGRFEWWSNRGDSIDSRLTRPVDLRGVKRATLRFSIWYDVEKDFDYGYVEASADGGSTWKSLSSADTTTSDPNGQNYGNGLTGTSGGQTPAWDQETVDLSGYAGRQILVRFEYVTDDSFNADGIALDNVEIPEIGFKDNTQTDDGWQADGWTRIDDTWPQTYLVEALTPGSKTPVRRMALDARDRGTLKLSGTEPTIIAVAGLAPITTHPAPFSLRLSAG
ncbi:MAG: hypothetical protein ACRDIY_00715 [Chloroflexota bacterium]